MPSSHVTPPGDPRVDLKPSRVIQPAPTDKLYLVSKIAQIANSLRAEGASPAPALKSVNLSESDLISPSVRVSQADMLRFCRSALQLSVDPYFAFHSGLHCHISNYGMYGFAILSSTNFREAARFAVQYHALATPLETLSFEEGRDGAKWTYDLIPEAASDPTLQRFLVEHNFGVTIALHRDVMGHLFLPRELHVSYPQIRESALDTAIFGCPLLFGQDHNCLMFDARWLESKPTLGSELTYRLVVRLCDLLMEELKLRVGLAGRVREILLRNLGRTMSAGAVARNLNMTVRTLQRRLRDANTSLREVMDDLRKRMASKYLGETDLTVEEIAAALGFGEPANFRRAFQRWTGAAPGEFRRRARAGTRTGKGV